MDDNSVSLLINEISGLRSDIAHNHSESKERLSRADARQDKLEATLGDLAKNMGTLANSMTRLEQVQERMEEEADRQRTVDELQNHKLENLKEDWHRVDKALSVLESAPEELRTTRHKVGNLENQVQAVEMIQEELKEDVKDIKKAVTILKEKQQEDAIKLNSLEGWSKWFKERILPAMLLAGVPAAAMYYVMTKVG